jgi:RNA ligase (TIGR02306 family)
MSELIVQVCRIEKAEHHPNADRLDIVQVKGWNCIVGRDEFKPGDLCIYVPIDSVLPDSLEALLFRNTKVKLKSHRVRTAKIRGVISQGLVISRNVYDTGTLKEGDDVKDILGITKWEPPVKAATNVHGSQKAKRHCHPDFSKYTDMNHLNNYPNMLDDHFVAVTEKIHGTNFRCGWLPYKPRTFFQKLKNSFWAFFGKSKKFEFVFGSHNVQLQDGSSKQFYDTNVYARIVKQYDLKEVLRDQKGRIFYGEIHGSGIQKGYDYGLGYNNIDVVWFDIKQVSTNRYLGYHELRLQLLDLGLKPVPQLYVGPFDREILNDLCKGQSVLSLHQRYREGIVVKAVTEFNGHGGRSILKLLNPAYLMLKGNTEWH